MKTITVRGMTLGQGRPKICVPIVGRNDEEILEAADRILESPVDMVEWRGDWYENVLDTEKMTALLQLLQQRLKGIPLLATFRTREEGGEKAPSKEEYVDFCCRAVESGCIDFIDVELLKGEETIQKILEKAHEKNVYVILSSHDFQKTPPKEEIIGRLRSMQEMGGDVCKMAVMPNSRKDVLTLMEATLEMKEKWADRPLITMSMSGEGSLSRLAGEFFGSALTFGTVGRASAPGQIPAEELKEGLKLIHRSMAGTAKKPNLYLIGFMGSGKSTVASRLEKDYQLTRVEMDQEIQEIQGMSIPEMFEKYGEGYFRKAETRFLEELQERQGIVVSCGGGVVLKQENVDCMKENGKIVLLTAEPETILERVKFDENRPLLKGKKNVADIQKLMEARREKYEAAADYCVSTDGKNADQIAAEIMEMVK